MVHDTPSIGDLKVTSAARRLAGLNPFVAVEPINERLTSANAREVVARYDLILDGSDNFPTRYLVNDACVLEEKPFVYGSIFRFEGSSRCARARGPCYRCLFADPPAPELVRVASRREYWACSPARGDATGASRPEWIMGGNQAVGRLLLIDAGTSGSRNRCAPRPNCAHAATIHDQGAGGL